MKRDFHCEIVALVHDEGELGLHVRQGGTPRNDPLKTFPARNGIGQSPKRIEFLAGAVSLKILAEQEDGRSAFAKAQRDNRAISNVPKQ